MGTGPGPDAGARAQRAATPGPPWCGPDGIGCGRTHARAARDPSNRKAVGQLAQSVYVMPTRWGGPGHSPSSSPEHFPLLTQVEYKTSLLLTLIRSLTLTLKQYHWQIFIHVAYVSGFLQSHPLPPYPCP